MYAAFFDSTPYEIPTRATAFPEREKKYLVVLTYEVA
jgi:hypothetical protein